MDMYHNVYQSNLKPPHCFFKENYQSLTNPFVPHVHINKQFISGWTGLAEGQRCYTLQAL